MDSNPSIDALASSIEEFLSPTQQSFISLSDPLISSSSSSKKAIMIDAATDPMPEVVGTISIHREMEIDQPSRESDFSATMADFKGSELEAFTIRSNLDVQRLYSCSICGQRIRWAHHLRRHYIDMHALDSFQCKKCHIYIHSLNDYLDHIRNVCPMENFYDPRIFSCNICKYRKFLSRQMLIMHKRECMNEKKLCNFCLQTLPNNLQLQVHVTQAHLNIELPWENECKVCRQEVEKEDMLVHFISQHTSYVGEQDQEVSTTS